MLAYKQHSAFAHAIAVECMAVKRRCKYETGSIIDDVKCRYPTGGLEALCH